MILYLNCISDGFRKVSRPEQGVLSKVQANEPIEFWHPNFRRGHPELLYLVQRRVSIENNSNSFAVSNAMFVYFPFNRHTTFSPICMYLGTSYTLHIQSLSTLLPTSVKTLGCSDGSAKKCRNKEKIYVARLACNNKTSMMKGRGYNCCML